MSEVTSALTWENDKIQLKNLVVEEKWDSLDEAHLLVIGNIATDRVIILIDDLYQSGTTLQYVAMKLQEAGASAILGLSLVKSRRDTDNA